MRGLEGFSFIWLLWHFSVSGTAGSRRMVRPPRLGGNTRVGVFASRAPNRPNGLGLSSVRLESVEYSESRGPLLHVLGPDLLDGTPILDIKPYIEADCHPDAATGFAGVPGRLLAVADPGNLLDTLSSRDAVCVRDLLSLDPRPAYHKDPERIYGMAYNGFEVRFTVADGTVYVREMLRHSGPPNER